jgi:acyl-CoA thioesterase-1
LFSSIIVRNTLLFLLLLCPVAFGAEAPRILVLGDSLSAGYGLSSDESWVSLLQTRLNASGYPREVINASITGDTTRGGLARLPRALKIYQPGIVIIELGGNDGLRAIPIGEIRRNMDGMIQLARKSGASVLVAGIRLPPNYGPDYTNRFHATLEDAAKAHGAAFVPFILEDVALVPGMMQGDGIHPTAAAQSRILDNVWPYLEQIIENHD